MQDQYIPSFFRHSVVKSKYVFDENNQNFGENIFTDYDTPNYVRIMKRFTTPDIEAQDDKEPELIESKSQGTFYLRCYFPKRAIVQAENSGRIRDVVIMINGLNETTRFDFYDQLASHFASLNVASILIPTPYHLNRRTITDDKKIREPLYMAKDNPMLFYYNFKRSIHEIENLCDRIIGNINHPEDLGFYDAYFARGSKTNIRITLFGYSLGGLRALGCFMKGEQEENRRYHSCIAFNSTADPFEADLEKLGFRKKDFEQIKKAVNKAINSGSITAISDESKLIRRIFVWLYNRNNDAEFVDALKLQSKKFLMVQSAADEIVARGNEWNITDPKHGLNSIVVAGVGHIVMRDKNWHQYLATLSNQLTMFMQNAGDSSFSAKQIQEKIHDIIFKIPVYIELNNKYRFKDDFENMDFTTDLFQKIIEQIPGEEDKKNFIELYFLSKGHYPKFPELLANIMEKKARAFSPCVLLYDTVLHCGPGEEYKPICNLKALQKIKPISMGSEDWLQIQVLSDDIEKLVGYIPAAASSEDPKNVRK
jgi:hypothetical protein